MATASPNLQVGAPEGLHGDAADRDERRVPQVDAVRDRHHVADRGGRHLGVAARRVGHGLADLQPCHAVADGQHRARAAIADLPRGNHLVPDPPRGLAGPGGEDGLLDHVPHPGIGDGLAHKFGRRLGERPHLRARADERIVALHQYLIRSHMRDGKVGDQDPSAPIDHPAEHLLHADLNLLSVRVPPAACRAARAAQFVSAPRYQSQSAITVVAEVPEREVRRGQTRRKAKRATACC